MRSNQACNAPAARFVIERKAGTGYRVASAEGIRADEWKDRALTLLDDIGQLDPKGPPESVQWIGPVGPTGEYVGVLVKLLESGESRYQQAWFTVHRKKPLDGIGLILSVSLIALIAGAISGAILWGTRNRDPLPGTTASGGKGPPPNVDPKEAAADVRVTELKKAAASSQGVQRKMRAYLSQKGLSADTSKPVVDERRSVKMIADLDTPPPKQESIRLSNIDVARLLDLLDTLEEWDAGSASPRSEKQ